MSERISTGIPHLDSLLDGLYIGDNVVWHDDAGSLATVFCLNFLEASRRQARDLIYVCFDRSPRNLLEKLGPVADWPRLTVLDCFTHGKGAGAEVFLKFYRDPQPRTACRVLAVQSPADMGQVMQAVYDLHASLSGDVRLVFESLTGMQELWRGEEEIIRFYAHSCPHLYELRTIAYWIIEKRAHSPRLRAQINQIAQVVIDLAVRRGKTFLTVLKAEKRSLLEALNKPLPYWARGLETSFEAEARGGTRLSLGGRLRELRSRRGLSQTELAKCVGVTPSTISQVESNLIFPSLPALFKMAEVLGVATGALFEPGEVAGETVVFPAAQATPLTFPDLPRNALKGKRLTPVAFSGRAEPMLLEIAPRRRISGHFLRHKGEELGYLAAGTLQLKIGGEAYTAAAGDLIYLTRQLPAQWFNPGPETARLLWIKLE
jgi:transcriptional regulator with XRE-family HTH domain/KaiC/GvpD/RAD55 family RecA-like ATPase